jgi:hypothetical protein
MQNVAELPWVALQVVELFETKPGPFLVVVLDVLMTP